jgi:hypothetical protein
MQQAKKSSAPITDAPYRLLTAIAAFYAEMEKHQRASPVHEQLQPLNDHILESLANVYHWGEKLRPHASHPGLREHFVYIVDASRRLERAHAAINLWTPMSRLARVTTLSEGLWQRCLRRMASLGFEHASLETMYAASQYRIEQLGAIAEQVRSIDQRLDESYAVPAILSEHDDGQ